MDTDTLSNGTHIQHLAEEQQFDIGQQQQQQQDHHSHQDADKPHQQKTLALIKPDAMQANHKQAIIDKILAFGFTIIQQKQLQFDLKQASLFYREHEHKSFYPQLTEWMSSAPIYAMVLEKENAIQDWRFLMGPTDANKAREINPTSIRALFGTDGSHNATHGSDCLTSAEREIDIVFNSHQESSADDHDLSTTNTATNISAGEEASVQSGNNNNNNNNNKEMGDSGDNTNTLMPSAAVDVEHPANTPEILSHPASLETTPTSDSVEPAFGAAVTFADMDPEQDDVNANPDDSTSQPTIIKNDDANETNLVNSIVDETSVHNKDDSLLAQQHQENLVTEGGLDDHSTIAPGLSYEPSITQQDNHSASLETSSDPLDDCGTTGEKDSNTVVALEAHSLLANEEKPADDTSPLGLDTNDDDKHTSLADEEANQQQQQVNKVLDDNNHDVTPEQETELLAVKETTASIVESDITSNTRHEQVDPSDELLTTQVDSIHEITSADTNNNEATGLDNDNKATRLPTDEEHHAATEENFDTIPLAGDAEEDTTVTEEPAVVAAADVVVAEETADQVSKSSVAVSEPVVVASVAVIAEETPDQVSAPIVSVLEPAIHDETSMAASDDGASAGEHIDPTNTVEPESVEGPVEEASLVEHNNQYSSEEEKEPHVSQVTVVDEEAGSTNGNVEQVAVEDDHNNGFDDVEKAVLSDDHTNLAKDLAEPSTIDVHDEPIADQNDTINNETLSHEEHQSDTTSTKEDLSTEDVTESTVEHSSPTSDHNNSSTGVTTVDEARSVSTSEESANQKKTSSSDESQGTKEANKPASPTRSPLKKSTPGTLKTPTKISSTRKSPTSATKSGTANTAPAAAATRLRRPGTTSTTAGTESPVKKATGLKSSTSPGRTPLPRVATLANKKSDSNTTTATETKPATKKRSSVINRLTAPTTASANKRTSDSAATITKSASGNGTHRVKTTSGTAPPTTRRTTAAATTTKTTTTGTEKPAVRRTSPSSTVDKPTTRRISPTSSHGNKTARSTTSSATSSRLSSTTTKSPSPDANGGPIKRAPVRRISPPASAHSSTATKPSTKTNKVTTATEKKGDIKRKVATKPSGTKPTKKEVVKEEAPSDQVKGGDEATLDETLKPDEATKDEMTLDEISTPSEATGDETTIDETSTPGEETEDHQAPVETPEQQAVHSEQDTKPSDTTLKPTESANRPKTPELAQLRSKFETLQTSSLAPTRSSNNKPSSTPHNIKDLISRFN